MVGNHPILIGPWLLACLVALGVFGQTRVDAQFFSDGFSIAGLSERAANSETSEEEDEIETDRDSFTASTKVMKVGRWMVESSYSYIDNRNVYDTHSLPELLLRYGITERAELRFGYNYEVGGAGNPISGNVPDDLEEEAFLESEARLFYGTKIRLSNQSAWIPESVFLLHGYTPTAGKETATSLGASYVFGWKLRNQSVWDSGIHYGTNTFQGDNFNTWSPSTVLKIPVGERWRLHAEYFGVMSDGRQRESVQHFFSPGIHYLVSKDIEVGIRVGWGLNDQSPNFFNNIGIGWQF